MNHIYVIDSNGQIILRGIFNCKVWFMDQGELVHQLNTEHTINFSSTMRNGPICIVNCNYHNISAERLRQLYK